MPYNPAPGWPPAPEGYIPPASFTPPAGWPQPPADWPFYVDDDGAPMATPDGAWSALSDATVGAQSHGKAAARSPSRWQRNRTVVGVGAVALILGAAAGGASSTTAKADLRKANSSLAAERSVASSAMASQQSLQSDLATAKQAQADAESKAQAAANAAIAGADAKAQADEAAKQAALDAQKAALDSRSADLDKRAAAIGQAETAYAANTIPGDGTFLVGTDVQPGTYKSTGNASTCYWSRDSKAGDIIANDISTGQLVMTVAASDFSVTTKGCSDFHPA